MLQKLFLVLLPLFWTPKIETDFIEWSPSRKLSWADFKGSPNPSSSNVALTNSSINAEFGFNNSKLIHTIKCRFSKSLSWVRVKTDYILNHEQGHFDIAEIHARILHKELQEYEFNAKTVNKDINRIYEEVMKLHVTTQKNYDLQTNHSIDTAKQGEWDRKIRAMLSDNKNYADYR